MDILTKIPPEFYLFALAILVAAGAGLAVIIFAQVKQAVGILKGDGHRQEIHPQPLVVREHTEFATREELEAVGAQVQGVDTDLKTLRREIVENGEKRRASIEGKVEAMRKECLEHTESVRLELSDKLDGMEGRIIATLKNTGAI